MEIPNLRQKATTILSRKLGEWCLGLEPPEDPFLPQRNQLFFVLYSIAAAAYRWVVALSICWFLYRLFLSYHLEIVGKIDGGGVAVGAVFHAAVASRQVLLRAREDRPSEETAFLHQSGRADGGCCLAFLFLPLPHSFICPLEIQPRDADSVYVDVPGRLVELDVKAGQQVVEGQPLAQLENIDLDLEVAKLQGSLDENETKLKSLIAAGFPRPPRRGPNPADQGGDRRAEETVGAEREATSSDCG